MDAAVVNTHKDLKEQGTPAPKARSRPGRMKALSSGVGTMIGLLTVGGMNSGTSDTGPSDADVLNTHSFSDDSDDEESDIDDVPEAILYKTRAQQRGLKTTIKKIDLVAFFQSPRYRIMSFLYGPMACFVFVAQDFSC
jgi:hypothetical protein